MSESRRAPTQFPYGHLTADAGSSADPVLVEIVQGYRGWQHGRHAVKPGITGWAQINYPYGASIEDARRKLEYDLYYIENWSLLFDIRIILRTLFVGFSHPNAY